ncbi:hypothetical protein G7Y79_00027g060940 [Physcia stellaris]|nr:hypothetical protein G7Y79_00027g060940 [Physcia stellaris]
MSSILSPPSSAMSRKVEDASQQAIKPSENLMSTSIDVDDAKDQIGFFSLPPELRNKIMDLVLVPGDVYLRLPPFTSRKLSMENPSTRSQFRIGAQLLATNRQAYNEGRVKYYSMNRFHLPSLSLSDCQYILNRYQTKNLEMVRHVTLDCYLTQFLNEDMVKDIEESLIPKKLMEENGRLDYDQHYWYPAILRRLFRVWGAKLHLIRRYFPHLESLIISQEVHELEADEQSGGSTRHKNPRIEQCIFEGSALQEDFEPLDNLTGEVQRNHPHSVAVHRIFSAARESALELERSIDAIGWEKTKTSLMTRAEADGLVSG